jgi:hypothetical protein
MNLLKTIFYFVLAFLIVRYLLKIMYPPKQNQNGNQPRRSQAGTEAFEKPTIKIEAESVDYEIIEEPKKKNEE